VSQGWLLIFKPATVDKCTQVLVFESSFLWFEHTHCTGDRSEGRSP
jgi:hypothetical protein